MEQMLGADVFLPQGFCLRWNPQLMMIMVAGNLLVVGGFYSIPAALVTLLKRREDVAFHWMFKLFATFIFFSGTTHLLKILTIWYPYYWLAAWTDFITGALSVVTAVLLWPLIPRIIAMPSPEKLQTAYDDIKMEMRKREDAEHRSKLLASIVESSDDAIISFLLNGTVLSWNKGAQELFGYSVESTMGKSLNQLIGPNMGALVDILKKGEHVDALELTYSRADGQEVNLSVRVSLIKDGKDNATGAAIFRDITKMKLAERELRITSERLTQSNKELEEFAWVAAHDLKEPVRTMGTYAKLLCHEYKDELEGDGSQFLTYISDASVKAIGRIDDFLQFANVGRESLAPRSVDLNSLVEDVVQDLNRAITDSGATVSVSKLPSVLGRAEYIASLLQNLTSNAIKYHGERAPVVTIDATRSNSEWIISIRDNGIGFDMENAEKIFRMFYRLHSDDEYPGTGLGLSLCKKIVELHGGRIWAESERGVGSTFYFTLPAEPSTDEPSRGD